MGSMIGVCIMLVLFAPMGFTQEMRAEKPAQCKRMNEERGKFKTLFAGAWGRTSFGISVKVDPKNQTDANYVAVTDELKTKYCKEQELYIAFFDTQEHYKLFNIPQPERPLAGTPRALYVLNRRTGREVLEVYTIVNAAIETREIKLQ